ncbi:MAG: hypothetical protein E6J28_13525 [Chloroflexi bacterium]|nr:MAG: hypothetical protein E6J28_13525 [Chloroflexota bacterium]
MHTQGSDIETNKAQTFTVLFEVGTSALAFIEEEGGDFLPPSLLESFFEHGSSDATFGRRGQLFYAEFDRNAPSFSEAVLTAIADLEAASSHVLVVRVEPEELVNAASIAERTGRTREGVRLHIAGLRGPGKFPEPRFYLDSAHPIWTWSAVAAWYAQYTGEESDEASDAAFLAALNAALEIRRYAPSALGVKERDAIADLVMTGLHK